MQEGQIGRSYGGDVGEKFSGQRRDVAVVDVGVQLVEPVIDAGGVGGGRRTS
jgi:hypothetical protein